MKKNSAFQLRSGNKPSMVQLSGVSPVKLSQFQKDVQARKAKNKAKLKAKRAERKASEEPSKIKKDVTNVFSRVDKAIQGFFNNPRGKQRTGKNEYVPAKKGAASNQSSTPPPNNFRGMKGGDPKYSYKKNSDGSYTGKNSEIPGKTFTIKKGEAGYGNLEKSGLKMKKKSSVKLKKKK